jgi:hypothetical protein
MQVRFSEGEFVVFNGSVFQWIEFQIPILKMQVRFLPGLQQNNQRNQNRLIRKDGRFLFFMTNPICSSILKCAAIREAQNLVFHKLSNYTSPSIIVSRF